MYDVKIGKFHPIDPKTEKFPFQSPFVYAANNSIKFIDEYLEKYAEDVNQNGTGCGKMEKDVWGWNLHS